MNQTHKPSTFDNWLLFLMGLGALPSVKIVGYITVTEVALLVIAPLLILRRSHLLRDTILKKFVLLLSLWLVSAICSDLYRGVAFDQYSRGWARVILLGLSIVVGYILMKPNPRAYRYFLFGLALSSIVVLYGGRVGLEDYESISGEKWENSFETTYVYIALYSALFFGALYWIKSPKLTAWVLALVGCLNIAMGSRTLGGVLIMGMGTALFLRFSAAAQNLLTAHLSAKKTLTLTAFVVVFAYATFEGYAGLAANGYLGEKAQNKFEFQSQGRFGVIISGRINVVGAVLALIDSPLIGFGSWAEDRNGYFYQAVELVGYDSNALASDGEIHANRIPTHSYILEAWVEHGFVAAWFWFYTLWFLTRFIRRTPFFDQSLLVVVCVHFWLFLWNIFFSPMGGRPVIGAAMAIMIVLYDQSMTASRSNRLLMSPAPSIPPGLRRVRPSTSTR